jgi:hypothetical protein
VAAKKRRRTATRSPSNGPRSKNGEPNFRSSEPRSDERIVQLEQALVDAGRITGQFVQDITKLLHEAIPEIVAQEQQATAQAPDNTNINAALRDDLQSRSDLQNKVMDAFIAKINSQTSAYKRR